MGRQQQKNSNRPSTSGGDLLNFHFSSGPPPQQQQNSGRRRNQNQHNYNNHNYNRKNKGQQNRSSARGKPNSNHFSLHASADHAFVITRHGLKAQQYSFSGSDEPVSWESVRMVKCLVSSEREATCCPVCLDNLVCARITKCGHFYCLPCLLRHVQVHAQSNPYTHVKCPCCALPLHTTELRPVVWTTALPPTVRQRIKLTKLHRTKDCLSPYLPQPEAPKRSSSHAAPCTTDIDAPFCRFNYIDCASYQEHLEANKAELEAELRSLTKHQPQPQYRGPQQNQFHQQKYQADVEAIFVTSALSVVQKELSKAMEEINQEQELKETFSGLGSGVYQQQSPQLVANNYEYTKLPPQQQSQSNEADGGMDNNIEGRPRGESVASESSGRPHRESVGSESERYRRESVGSESESVAQRYRGDSIGSYASANESGAVPTSPGGGQQPKPNNKGKRNKGPRKLPQASMYLDDEGSSHFYQSQDGQLVFLSRFNMSCLMADFSPKVPELESLTKPVESLNYWERRKLLPLPDTIEGEILEIESVHLTPDMRKRMQFLSHLPLYTDIQFVELDLNSILSIECKKKFKAELDKRRKKRQSKVKAEKREDKMAQKKEEERINELKARMQQIDPNDEFFQVSVPEEPLDLTGDAFGPAISGSRNSSGAEAAAVTAAVTNSQPAFSFSNVCQSGGAFPSLAVNSEQSFPSLGASPPSRSGPAQPPPTWGSPSRASQAQPTWGQPKAAPTWGNQRSNAAPVVTPVSTGATPAEISKQPPMPKSKKKGKGKKIVLFSSGGQRGTSY